MGYEFRNTDTGYLKGVVVNKALVVKTFAFWNGVWVHLRESYDEEDQLGPQQQGQPQVQIPPNVGGGLMDDIINPWATTSDDIRRAMNNMNISVQQGFTSLR